ncbi:MAG: hypothetical protein ACKO23_08245 [Gemmataceae bacterium]
MGEKVGNRATSEHRKKIWIDPFQTGLLLRIGVYLVVCLIAVWAFMVICDKLTHGVEAIGGEWPFLSNNLVRIMLALLIVVPPLALDAVRFAHRLVGPIYAFRRTVRAVAAGEPVSLVKLRKDDLLMDFRDDFNRMLQSLEERGLVILKTSERPANAEKTEAAS